jgi:SAM-dependent methyltransferase
MRLRVFTACQAVVDAATVGVRSVHEGLWLGLLDHRHLQVVTDQRYESWRRYGSDDHNLSGLMPWEESALDRFFGGCSSLLVGAAGGGREVLALAGRGYQVTAFDCSAHLLDHCRRLVADEGIAVATALCPPDRVPDGVGRHDGAIMGWGGYMHIPGRAARVGFLEQIRSHLLPGGPLLLSFFSNRQPSRSDRWVAGIAGVIRRVRRSRDPVEIGDRLAGTFDHRFCEEEIASELESAGFEMVHFAHQPYGHAVGRLRPDRSGDACAERPADP